MIALFKKNSFKIKTIYSQDGSIKRRYGNLEEVLTISNPHKILTKTREFNIYIDSLNLNIFGYPKCHFDALLKPFSSDYHLEEKYEELLTKYIQRIEKDLEKRYNNLANACNARLQQ